MSVLPMFSAPQSTRQTVQPTRARSLQARLNAEHKPRVVARQPAHDKKRQSMVGFCAVALLAVAMLIGNPAKAAQTPFYDLLSLDGERIKDDADVGKGRWTLVMIWSSDCHICKAQKPVISEFHDKHKDTDAHVFGIALDGRSGIDDVHSYLAQHPATFPNYVGELSVVALSFLEVAQEQFRGTPTYVLFGPTGEVKGVNPGPVSLEALEKFIASN